MNDVNSTTTRPIWADAGVIPKQPQLSSQLTVDVCVIGAGISGLTAADLLKRSGKTVVVIDLGRIGCGETLHTTGHLTEVFDLDYRDLLSKFGVDGAQLAAQSMRNAIERIEQNAAGYGIDCGFERVAGYQFTEKKLEIAELEAEAEAASKVGVAVELMFEAPLPFKTARALRFPHQAQFNPTPYLAGLAQRIVGNGSYIFEDTRMTDIEEGEPCRVVTDRGTIVCDDVFVATNVPSSNRLILHTKIAAYRTYAIAVRANRLFDSKNLFWDIDNPYHYVRSLELGGVPHLLIGGEDHKTGKDAHTGTHFDRLEKWADERFNLEAVTHRWSGQVIESVDGLPFIGRNPMSNHVYVATGFSGTGLAFGTIGAMLVSDLILGNQNPWIELYDAARVKPLASMKQFFSENIDFPSHLISDRLSAAQVSNTEVVRENSGALVRIGGKKVAAYRDPKGELHLMSPVCPHMGCYVGWNEAEKSWDCPCHGSRFDPCGKLLNGPAVSDLASEEADENVPMVPERYEQPGIETNPLGGPVLSFFTCPIKCAPKA
jgi:glycine/D-amino acid oxidase-like deaminating enzyme/nitrite reductase/ring-hydroxylating ferredoxin subunit